MITQKVKLVVMKLFLSKYLFKIDKKGRVSLPSSYRSVISEKNKVELILFKSIAYLILIVVIDNNIAFITINNLD